MDEFMSVLNKSNDIDEINKEHIKEHLKNVFSQDVYDKWVEHFVVEEIDDEQIIIGYYGSASLRKFEKKYKKMVWLEICSCIGCVKKLNIYKRKGQPDEFNIKDLSEPFKDDSKQKEPEIFTPNKIDEQIELSVTEPLLSKDNDKKNKNTKSILKNPLQIIRVFIVFGIIAGLLSVTAVLGVNYISNRTFAETFYNLGNIKANDKIRIVQISDLHSSTYGEENSLLIKRVKKLKPDIIVFTGDCIEPNEASVEAIIKTCSNLADVAHSYYVYGNNEVDWVYGFPLTREGLDDKFGFDDDNRNPEKLLKMKDDFEKKLEKTGVTVLKNEKDTISVGSTMVDIYGSLTSNPSAFWPYGGESFSDFIYSDESHLKIFAIHEPFVFEKLESDFWGDFMLCGHTHGGMMKIPLLGPLYTPEGGLLPEKNNCYVSGRYSVTGNHLIVSPGLENNDILRINNKPELTIIDINRF